MHSVSLHTRGKRSCLSSSESSRDVLGGSSVPMMVESTVAGDVDSLVGRIMPPGLEGPRSFEHASRDR